ncbi:hypothetical protein [Mucilaginibacter sp. SP1R1]|uniref:hypothetical protein n=1 Tax=Mucilaginibacter sp. SP1R1 TaxID=2723091 RepID=UPI001619D542|nr:hypothetical protein [Mucilaginibacter sp. SP1R1]MBB6150998.1 hypothetical protein [Mucilaginibacter sp. SP1R1]
MKIYWYRHAHENRNDLLRFGLMKLHMKGGITYIEKDISQAIKAGFSKDIALQNHKHISFLTIVSKEINKKIIVDNEDSFIHCSNYIKEVDIYFTASYNSTFYKNKNFPEVYKWQTQKDIEWYKFRAEEIINKLGLHFYKVKPFVPIAPNLLSYNNKKSLFKQKFTNIMNRFSRLFKGNNYWLPMLDEFNQRYIELESLRKSHLKYDVTLNDTLWGWPKHRLNLHYKLSQLGVNYNINSILNWHKPYINDTSINLNINAEQFPIICGNPIVNYEKMLSESRLAIFAAGFHWGWRNIMTLALFCGLPILTDKPIFDPYFPLTEFKLFFNSYTNWETIEPLLNDINADEWNNIKLYNQKIYDKYLSPLSVANYFLKTIHN